MYTVTLVFTSIFDNRDTTSFCTFPFGNSIRYLCVNNHNLLMSAGYHRYTMS